MLFVHLMYGNSQTTKYHFIIQEYYFRSRNLSYKPLPAFRKDCENPLTLASMDLIYPKPNARIFVPRELSSQLSSTVFEVVHRNPSMNVYWHLDGNFIGSTCKSHKMALSPSLGRHVLTLVDDNGEGLTRSFSVISGQ